MTVACVWPVRKTDGCLGWRFLAGLCTEKFHCRLASTDEDDACPPQYSICETCQRFGKLTMHAVVRHVDDAEMVTASVPMAEIDRTVAAALEAIPADALGPDLARVWCCRCCVLLLLVLFSLRCLHPGRLLRLCDAEFVWRMSESLWLC